MNTPASKKVRAPHVVSAGYQRFFTADGKRIRVVTKNDVAERRYEGKPVSVLDNFKEKKYFLRVIANGNANDELEDEFARVENISLPLIRSVVHGTTLTSDQARAIKAMMAIHFARSYAHEEVRKSLFPQVVDEQITQALADPRVQAHFHRTRKRPASQEDAEALVRTAQREMENSREYAVTAIIRAYTYAIKRFETQHLQLLRPASRRMHFITGDSPTLLARDNTLTVVGATNLALGDANFVATPLRPNLFARVAPDEAHLRIDNVMTIRLNQAMVRNCLTRIALHPATDLSYALGRTTQPLLRASSADGQRDGAAPTVR